MSILGQLGLGTVALRLLFSLWGQKRGPCARVTPGSPRTHTSNSRCQGGPEPSGWEWIHVVLEDPSSPSGVPSHTQGMVHTQELRPSHLNPCHLHHLLHPRAQVRAPNPWSSPPSSLCQLPWPTRTNLIMPFPFVLVTTSPQIVWPLICVRGSAHLYYVSSSTPPQLLSVSTAPPGVLRRWPAKSLKSSFRMFPSPHTSDRNPGLPEDTVPLKSSDTVSSSMDLIPLYLGVGGVLLLMTPYRPFSRPLP